MHFPRYFNLSATYSKGILMAIDQLAIEKKWQTEWKKAKLFEPAVVEGKKKFFITFPYPYLNGSMHVGHSYSFFRTDAFARYMRLKAFSVLFPQGFHATGEPIMGTVERLRNNDQAQIESFRKAGASDKDIEKFKEGPEEVAMFWKERWARDLQAGGASIDWRRSFITTDLTPTYSRFIEWQYNTLKKKGYVVQGTHPVIYCPHDQSPTGDHDRYRGEGESPVEYVILKFELEFEGEKLILPCATLRPETIYGATNIWLNPDGKYHKVKVDSEFWLLPKYAAEKLSDQQHKTEVFEEIPTSKLIGKECKNPLLNKPVPILPAKFASTEHTTGVVMSVPAHAPYDFIAIEDLKKNEAELAEFRLKKELVAAISPISIISVEGYGDFPAEEECSKLKITSQNDMEKLEKATSEVYKHEFHKGVLKQQFGDLAGQTVRAAKEKLIAKFKTSGFAASIWESTAEVICRCMTRCHVKILENQWFLKFSDEKWKMQVLSNIEQMNIYPEEARLQMINTVAWLQNKACARKGGMGTKLPWDSKWKVETLSDSTIYMAYYTLARIIDENSITKDQLPDEVFDFIFLSKGKLDEISLKTSLKKELITEMKKEFEYFYPVDLRNSGKDLLQNHLLFFLFHHSAIFEKQYLPKGMSVNGYVTVEGEKMSKSKGNFFSIRELIEENGADIVRLNIISAGEGLDDADWRSENLKTFKRSLDFIFTVVQQLNSNAYKGNESGRAEKLLESKSELCFLRATENMDALKFRSALHFGLFEALDALKKYLNSREQNANPKPLKEHLLRTIQILSPYSPHFSEEVWHMLGNDSFCSTSLLPSVDNSKIDHELEEEETYLENLISDIQKIIDLKGTQPQIIRLFVSEKWKRNLFEMSLKSAKKEGKFDISIIMKEAMQSAELKMQSKSIPGFLKAINKAVNFYKADGLPALDELELLQGNSALLEKHFKCKIEILQAEQPGNSDPEKKALKSLPLKPALFLIY